MMTVYCFLCLTTSLLFATRVNSTTYYVKSDDYFTTNNNTFTLQYYISNTKKYFSSNNELCFLPGVYHLNMTLSLKDVHNFTLSGINDSTIMCATYESMMIINVTNFTMKNLNFIGCGKYHNNYVQSKYKDDTETSFNKTGGYGASIFIDNCKLINISDISITANVGFAGLLVINLTNYSLFIDIKVQINCSAYLPVYDSQIHQTNGILFFYKHWKTTHTSFVFTNISIDNFQYKSFGLCLRSSHYAIALFIQHCSPILFNIQNMMFSGLHNSSLLYYRDTKCTNQIENHLFIKNVKVLNNIGNSKLIMYNINFADTDFDNRIFQSGDQKRRSVFFRNCQFTNNINMETMIFILPTNADKITGYIEVRQSEFNNNTDAHFITVKREAEAFWQINTHIKIHDFTATLNKHHDGDSLISIIGGKLIIEGPTFFNENGYYRNIIKLHMSMIVYKEQIEFTNNHARHIISGNSGSYFMITEYTTFTISYNTIYKVAKYVDTLGENAHVICPIQFYSTKGNFDKNPSAFNCIILLLNNTFMTSKNLKGFDSSFYNCKWLGGSAFDKTDSKILFLNLLLINNTVIKNTEQRIIPLSVCPCTNSRNYSCLSSNLGSLFPGQTLKTKLIVSKQWVYDPSFVTTLLVANTLYDNCSVVDSHQLSQTHFNHDCNTYEYTIWPSYEFITECTLFVGLRDMPEMFYVDIKPCPKGFTQQQDKKACSCDPLLDNNILSITSCNMDSESILRPANSWISAETVNHSHTYQIGSQCPFDYCLPYSSYLNLSNRDSQCQFGRSGVLCGQCQQGYSSVFGSSQCMQCSFIYLFIVIPIAIAGVILVILLFTFNLTITNGAINSFIFYVNIISINYSLFYTKNHSLDYVLLSLFNLDLGIETCFYNGMDDYAKILLQLAFPCYLILIASVLIISSRYSAKIQKLTAHRALPVLSTLFLLSYTKLLLTVCQVLFRYTRVIQYPSEDSKLVWLVDVSVPLFGIRFLIAFFICLITFLILLLFNILLLFTRKLLCIKVINRFKPLLDPYFGPYKDRYYYWTGLQILIRALFLGLSAFSTPINLISGIIVLGTLLFIQGPVHPFKSRYKNYQELLLLLNLQAVYTIALYNNFDNSVDMLIVRILIMIVQAYIIICVTCHCVVSVPICHKKVETVKKKISDLMQKQPLVKNKKIEMNNINHSEDSENYYEFQEPLIGLDN